MTISDDKKLLMRCFFPDCCMAPPAPSHCCLHFSHINKSVSMVGTTLVIPTVTSNYSKTDAAHMLYPTAACCTVACIEAPVRQ